VIVASGTPAEILRSDDQYLREFVETSGAVKFNDDTGVDTEERRR
jgi:hypothetical protein